MQFRVIDNTHLNLISRSDNQPFLTFTGKLIDSSLQWKRLFFPIDKHFYSPNTDKEKPKRHVLHQAYLAHGAKTTDEHTGTVKK